MGMLISWLVYSLAIGITAYLLPGVHVESVTAAIVAALVLGLINAILKPVLVILTLPVTILTLGLFILVINALLILLAANIVPGFAVDGFWWALLFGIVLSVVSGVLFGIVKD